MKVLLIAILTGTLCLPLSVFGADSDNIAISSEISNGIKRLTDESVEFINTPFQLKNNNLMITAGLLGATALTYIYDKEIQQKLQTNQSDRMSKVANAGTLAGDPFLHLGIAALVYGGGIAADSPKWKQTGEMIGEALILADASTFIIKEAVGRGRPHATSSKNDFKPFGFKNNYDSFPSMHTSSSFALASVLAATSENYAMKTAYYLSATFVAFSRIYKNKHWTSDIILGAALGELSGRVVTNYHASKNKIALVPIAVHGGAGLAMVKSW